MKQTNYEERKHGKFFSLSHFAGMLIVFLSVFFAASCSDDDDPNPSSQDALIGSWVAEKTWDDYDEIETLKMTLTFNKGYTGSIVEEFSSETKATERYQMNFSWSISSDANGNDILRFSYVSGDKEMIIFDEESAALWIRQYVVTGKILNLYSGDGVWVFNKK